MNNMIGIYGIRNKINDKIYIGQSTNIKNRFVRHRTHLKHNKHANNHLQNSYNKHGKDAFEFVIIEECDEFQLCVTEQKWINHYIGMIYNLELFVEDKSGNQNSLF